MARWRWLGRTVAGALLVTALIILGGGLGQWRTRVLVERGERLLGAEQYVSAARAIVRAVALAPGDARAHYDLGLAYAGIGQCRAAVSHLEAAVRLAPRDARYEVGLAGILLNEGRMREALTHLEQAIRAEPGSADVRLLFADALRRAGDRAGMERQYREAIQLAGGSPLGTLAREQLHAALATREEQP